MAQEQEELILRGLSISKGIGIGIPIFWGGQEISVEEFAIGQKEVESEIHRYRKALDLSRSDVESLQRLSFHEGPPEVASILGTHLEMMHDPLLTSVIEERIRGLQRNTESVFHGIIEEYKNRFSTLQDRYFQERVRDIVDVSRRILGYLCPAEKFKMGQVPFQSVILAHELIPSETVEADPKRICGFVTTLGGVTSHAAIIARAKGIPFITNIDVKTVRNLDVRLLVVDGSEGLLILNPTQKTLAHYQAVQKSDWNKREKIKKKAHLKGETIDGHEVKVFANLENPKEIPAALKAGASGIGLFRSEYLFLEKKSFPTEEEQFAIYKKMVKALKGRPLVIRVFDVGGDKKVDIPSSSADAFYFSAIGPEENPALGCRAIRFLLRYPELLRVQLRAILRASFFGEIHILIPMVSDLSEVRAVKKYITSVRQECKKEKIPIGATLPLGCMIEVPSTALMSDVLAEEVDFVSIGTNDLIQYILAADRSNAHTAELYFSTHPSVLRLIRSIVEAVEKAHKQVILCGECAADPAIIPILVGLGIRNLSVAGPCISMVLETVRKCMLFDSCKLAESALKSCSSEALKNLLSSEGVPVQSE